MRLVWTPRARADLEQIIAYIAEDSPDAAQRIVAFIEHAVTQLCEQPGLGCPGRKEGIRDLILRKLSWGAAYVIPYRARRDQIELLAVIHSARQWPGEMD